MPTTTASSSSTTYVNLSYALDVPLTPVTGASTDKNNSNREQLSSNEKLQNLNLFAKQIYPKLEVHAQNANDEKLALKERFATEEEMALKQYPLPEPSDAHGNIEASLLTGTQIEKAMAKQKKRGESDTDKSEVTKDLNFHLQPFTSKLNDAPTPQILTSRGHDRPVGPAADQEEKKSSPTEHEGNVIEEKEIESIVSVQEMQNRNKNIAHNQEYSINVMQSSSKIEQKFSDSSHVDAVNTPTISGHDSTAQQKLSRLKQIQQLENKPSKLLHETQEPVKITSVPEPPSLITDELLNKVAALTQQLAENPSLNETRLVAEESEEQMSDKKAMASPTKLRSPTQLDEQLPPLRANNEQGIDEKNFNKPPLQKHPDEKAFEKKRTLQTASKVAEQLFENLSNELPMFSTAHEVKETSDVE